MGLNFSQIETPEKIKDPYDIIVGKLKDSNLHPAVKKHLVSEQLLKIKPYAVPDTLVEEIYPNENQEYVIITGVFGPLKIVGKAEDSEDSYTYIKIKKINDEFETCFKIIKFGCTEKISSICESTQIQQPTEPIKIENNYKTGKQRRKNNNNR